MDYGKTPTTPTTNTNIKQPNITYFIKKTKLNNKQA